MDSKLYKDFDWPQLLGQFNDSTIICFRLLKLIKNFIEGKYFLYPQNS